MLTEKRLDVQHPAKRRIPEILFEAMKRYVAHINTLPHTTEGTLTFSPDKMPRRTALTVMGAGAAVIGVLGCHKEKEPTNDAPPPPPQEKSTEQEKAEEIRMNTKILQQIILDANTYLNNHLLNTPTKNLPRKNKKNSSVKASPSLLENQTTSFMAH